MGNLSLKACGDSINVSHPFERGKSRVPTPSEGVLDDTCYKYSFYPLDPEKP